MGAPPLIGGDHVLGETDLADLTSVFPADLAVTEAGLPSLPVEGLADSDSFFAACL